MMIGIAFILSLVACVAILIFGLYQAFSLAQIGGAMLNALFFFFGLCALGYGIYYVISWHAAWAIMAVAGAVFAGMGALNLNSFVKGIYDV